MKYCFSKVEYDIYMPFNDIYFQCGLIVSIHIFVTIFPKSKN